MAHTNWISSKSIITDAIDKNQDDMKVQEPTYRKWVEDETRKFLTAENMVHKIALIDIDKFEGKLPSDYKVMCQAGCIPNKANCRTRTKVVEWSQQHFDCELNIRLDCPCGKDSCSCGHPIIELDADELWRNSHPEYMVAHMKNFYNYGRLGDPSSPYMYMNHFYLMSPAEGALWNTYYHLGDCAPINVDNQYEYRLNGSKIITNFEHGQVIVGYLGLRTDEDGFVMIPDHPYAIQAATWAIEENLLYRKWRTEGDKFVNLYANAKGERIKYIGLARNALRIPDAENWEKIMQMHRTRYFGAFGRNDLGNLEPDFRYPEVGSTRRRNRHSRRTW